MFFEHDEWRREQAAEESSFRNNASAGGQLEHPSEVNSSTTIGVPDGGSAANANLAQSSKQTESQPDP